jgi:hypothetical protein
MIKIKYGVLENNIDVTNICLTSPKLFHKNIITIPSGDENRAHHFTDPVPRVLKKIFIQTNDNNNDDDNGSVMSFDHDKCIKINMQNNPVDIKVIDTDGENKKIKTKLSLIHSKLKIKYGSFNDEFPEQMMATKYLTGNEKILEIGGNIGRNSLVIAEILRESGGELNDYKLVTMECSTYISKQLTENRNLNDFHFHIENSALSMKKLIQKGWDTLPSDTLLPDYAWVNTVTWKELKEKYNIVFDTLVLDCEGAFYYMLLDMPEMLENIKLIIMENDYWDLNHKNAVDAILINNNFYVDYVESGGWGPCYHNFFEVWKRDE